MTREEAIKILRIRKEYVTLIKENVLDEALDVAIEALQEPQLDVYAQEYKAYRDTHPYGTDKVAERISRACGSG